MAEEWAKVPAYAESLERMLGAGAAGDFLAQVEERSGEMLAQGRLLFERWLDAVVLPRVGAGTAA